MVGQPPLLVIRTAHDAVQQAAGGREPQHRKSHHHPLHGDRLYFGEDDEEQKQGVDVKHRTQPLAHDAAKRVDVVSSLATLPSR